MSPESPEPPRRQESLGPYQVPPATMVRLAALQQAIRDAGHGAPSKGLLIAALIYAASRAGEELESEILVPFRRDHPTEDQPR
jgi:hypothetical protein